MTKNKPDLQGGGRAQGPGEPTPQTPQVYTRKLAYDCNSNHAERALSVTWSASWWDGKRKGFKADR